MAAINPFPATTHLLGLLNPETLLHERVEAVREAMANNAGAQNVQALINTATQAFVVALPNLNGDTQIAFAAFVEEVGQWARQHQVNGLALAAGIGMMAAGSIVVGPAIAVLMLNAAGFSAAGPVAGMLAPWIQSTFYGGAVGAGSIFAMAQSAAMGGIAVAGPAGLVAGAAALGTGAAVVAREGNNHQQNQGQNPDN